MIGSQTNISLKATKEFDTVLSPTSACAVSKERNYTMSNSWKPVVQTDSSGKWYGNALRFATEQEANENAYDLMMRWLAVNEFGAEPSDDPPNYSYINKELKAL